MIEHGHNSEQLLRKVWTEERNGSWSYDRGTKTINGGVFSLSFIYKFLAIKLRIQGLHVEPSEHQHHERPLRDAIREARNFLNRNIKI